MLEPHTCRWPCFFAIFAIQIRPSAVLTDLGSLLDPSCSGSGIVNRLDHLLDSELDSQENEAEHERLTKLSAFQLLMVKHAMRFPSVTKIVYSTCSIHAIENEHVVRAALKSEEARTGNFKLAAQDEVLPTWHRRGLPEELDNPGDARSLIRCLPGEDATNGFFVSCFTKVLENDRRDNPDKPTQKRKSDDPGLGNRPQKKSVKSG
jgi:putative methyltransferase